MKLDWTINISELIAATVLAIGIVSAHTANVRKLQAIETKLDMVYTWFTSHVINRPSRAQGD